MSLSLQFKGFNYTASYTGDYNTGDTYAQMEQVGINSVALTFDSGINVATSGIYQNYTPLPGNDIDTNTGFTETATNISTQVKQSVAAGQSVMVRPWIDLLDPTVTGVPVGSPYVPGAWRQLYHPKSLQTFFDPANPHSYTSYIVSQAKAAQAAGAQLFDIGTELDALITTQTMGYWTTLIKDVRAVFKGQLTYSASWIDGGTGGSIKTIPKSFWQQIDYVGLDAYVVASDPNDLVGMWTKPPTNSILSQAFDGKSAIDFFEGAAEAAGKPLILTEMGYTNASDAATNPLDQNGTPDSDEQTALYQAFFDAWEQAGATSLVGTYFFNWNPGSFDGGGTSTDFTPQTSQSALDAVASGFSAPAPDLITLSTHTQTISAIIRDTTGPLEVIITPYAAAGGSGASVASGRVLLTQANTYSGGTLIEAGYVGLGNTQALGTGGLDILRGELDLNGFAVSLPTLRGGGRIVATKGATAASGPTVMTVDAGTYSGTLADTPGVANLELVKDGSGTLVLSGQSAYATTLLDGGTLEIAGAAASGASGITFGSQTSTLVIDKAALANSIVLPGKGHLFGSVISHFGTGDRIVIAGLSGTPTVTWNSVHGYNLTISGLSGVTGGTAIIQFAPVDSYASGLGAFTFGTDSAGDTIITVDSNPTLVGIPTSTFSVYRSILDKIAGGFTISDTAAHIVSALGSLAADVGHITSIAATDKPVVVGVASTVYRAALDKVMGGFAILDTASTIRANLDGLAADATHITSITAVAGKVAVSVAAFERDQAALDKIVGGFAISDTAAYILAAPALTTDLANITTITATDRPLVVDIGTFLSNEPAFDKVTGGTIVRDQASTLSSNFNAFTTDVAHIRAVTFTDPSSPVLALTASQANADAALLAKISGAYVLNIDNGGSTTTIGHGNGLTIKAASSGPDTITGGGTNETFVFNSGFGQDTITDVYRYMSGATHDTIVLPKNAFSDFAAVLHDATTTASGTIVTSPTTGDQLSLPKVSASALAAAQGDFKFV